MSSPASVRILSISDDDSIMQSRELLLQSAGYCVLSLTSQSVIDGNAPDQLNIAIIGQTVDDRLAMRLASNLRQNRPHILIMRIANHYTRPDSTFDGSCLAEDGPKVFLLCVAQLIEKGNTRECGG